ncbi:MAG: hypothetical protein ABJ308_09930 [Halieaceae bacterium]
MSSSAAQKICVGFLAFALFGAAWTSFRYFLAELHSFQGKRYERFWESKGSIDSTAQWQRARRHMRRALFYNTHNPDTLLRAARIHEWYSFTPAPEGGEVRKSLDRAAWYYDQAVSRRPAHGFSYSSRALLKARRWQVAENLSSDLGAAAQFSPWERVVLLQMAYATATAWPSLDDVGRQAFVGKLAAVALEQPTMAGQLLRVADEYGRKREICTTLLVNREWPESLPGCMVVERE